MWLNVQDSGTQSGWQNGRGVSLCHNNQESTWCAAEALKGQNNAAFATKKANLPLIWWQHNTHVDQDKLLS